MNSDTAATTTFTIQLVEVEEEQLFPRQEIEKFDASAVNYAEFNHIGTLKNHNPCSTFVCNICNQSFARSDDYQGHCLAHAGKKQHICKVCGRGFSRKGNLKAHYLTHSGTKPYSCVLCQKGFSRKEDLRGHQVAHDGDVYFCDACNTKHSRDEAREDCVLHVTAETNVCEFCGRSFVRKSNLKAHQLTHTGQKRYICEICKRGFSRKEDLDGHVLGHSGQSLYVCEICSKGFNRKGNYEMHCKTHKLEHSCELCGKTFAKLFGLQNHLKTHNNVGSFRCIVCDKAFARKASLQVHYLTLHATQGPKNCGTCYDYDVRQETRIQHLSDKSDHRRPVIIRI